MSAQANPLSSADLAAFVCAMEAGTVHGAADALDLTASAVTKRLQSLERRLGVQLFERSRQGLRSTTAGRRLYPEAKLALAALRDAEDAMVALARTARETLTIAASHTIGEFLLPGWLGAFGRDHPGVRSQVDIVNSPGVLAAVRDDHAALGFVEGLDDLGDLEHEVVQRDEIVAVVAGDHRWARRRSVRAAELRDEPYATREAGSGTRAVATAGLAAAGVELSPTLEVASSQSVKRAVAAGGFSLMSRLAIAAEVDSGALHALPVRDVDLTRDLRVVRKPRGRGRGPEGAFWRWLADQQH